MIRLVLSFVILGAAVTSLAQTSEERFSIEVNITGAEPGVGQVLVSLFNSSESYLVAPVSEVAKDVDGNGNVLVCLGDHAVGEYAIAVVYDKNKNGELDTGLFRIPKSAETSGTNTALEPSTVVLNKKRASTPNWYRGRQIVELL